LLKGFTPKVLYTFEDRLHNLHPNNKYVKEKMRQQMQMLRDKGMINPHDRP
jgi:type II restriction enzyme